MAALKLPPSFHAASITARRRLSPTVTSLTLNVPTLQSFQPGQWLDFVRLPFAEKDDWVGGFSIASQPRELPTLKLAVKESLHKPSQWVTHASQLGDHVAIRVGGTAVLLKLSGRRPHVFIAGGIGIVPLFSMYQYLMEHHEVSSATVYYSAKNKEELVFLDEMLSMAKQSSFFQIVTKSSSQEDSDAATKDNVTYGTGRSCLDDFLSTIAAKEQSCVVHLCGPPNMMQRVLERLDSTKHDVVYEKWW